MDSPMFSSFSIEDLKTTHACTWKVFGSAVVAQSFETACVVHTELIHLPLPILAIRVNHRRVKVEIASDWPLLFHNHQLKDSIISLM